jgi:hypothetical protein
MLSHQVSEQTVRSRMMCLHSLLWYTSTLSGEVYQTGRGFSRSWTSVNVVENETIGHEVMKFHTRAL